jgi:hypothetical protein
MIPSAGSIEKLGGNGSVTVEYSDVSIDGDAGQKGVAHLGHASMHRSHLVRRVDEQTHRNGHGHSPTDEHAGELLALSGIGRGAPARQGMVGSHGTSRPRVPAMSRSAGGCAARVSRHLFAERFSS